jgi:hypothetical protein
MADLIGQARVPNGKREAKRRSPWGEGRNRRKKASPAMLAMLKGR